jgi:nucleoside-triphosphatase
MGKTILLTGKPGCGKTTLIHGVISQYPGPAGGFYTQELRQSGVRVGFEIITLSGKRGVLAHIDFGGPPRVGKYGVDLAALERLAVSAVREALIAGILVIIDEIGPMEIASTNFRQVVLDALDHEASLLGSIVKRSIPFTDSIKRRPQVTLIKVDSRNRDRLPAHILSLLSA